MWFTTKCNGAILGLDEHNRSNRIGVDKSLLSSHLIEDVIIHCKNSLPSTCVKPRVEIISKP